jgi:hypothetical protein
MSTTRFRSDRPIEYSTQDGLERADFARRLAQNIQAWDGSESLVIGIHGDWGSGKSSVKNLVLERLGEFSDQSPRVLHFNPWMISGEQHVADAFFLETELVLEEEELGQDGKQRALAWRKYARHFETLAKLSTAVDVALPFIGAMAGLARQWQSDCGRVQAWWRKPRSLWKQNRKPSTSNGPRCASYSRSSAASS